jgi:hypothetical protein
MPRALVLLGAAAFALAPCRALAASNAQLVYARSTDAARCPDEGALREAVTARVGYDPFFPWAKRKVVAAITKRGRVFSASVELVDEEGFTHGAQELSTQGECGELLDAVALAIAIAIDPRLLAAAAPATAPVASETPREPAATPPPEASPQPLAPVPASEVPPVDADREAPHEEPHSRRLEASAGVVASTGVAPSPSVGLALGTDVRWSRFSVGVEGRIDAPASRTAPSAGSVSSWLAFGAIVPCGHLGAFFACGLAEAGVMQASSSGVTFHRATSLAWLAAGGRVGAFVPLGQDVLLRMRGDLVADLDPAILNLNGVGAWSAPRVAASLGVDAVVRFR